MRYVGERYQNWSVSRYLSLSADDQASVMAEAPLRFTEVEDDYGTNPTTPAPDVHRILISSTR